MASGSFFPPPAYLNLAYLVLCRYWTYRIGCGPPRLIFSRFLQDSLPCTPVEGFQNCPLKFRSSTYARKSPRVKKRAFTLPGTRKIGRGCRTERTMRYLDTASQINKKPQLSLVLCALLSALLRMEADEQDHGCLYKDEIEEYDSDVVSVSTSEGTSTTREEPQDEGKTKTNPWDDPYYYFDRWYPDLQAFTFPSAFLPLNEKEAQAVLDKSCFSSFESFWKRDSTDLKDNDTVLGETVAKVRFHRLSV